MNKTAHTMVGRVGQDLVIKLYEAVLYENASTSNFQSITIYCSVVFALLTPFIGV